MSILYTTAAVGGFVMLVYGLEHRTEAVFPVLFFVIQFGISGAYNLIYVCHQDCFPTLFSTSSFGYCMFMCRLASAVTPIIVKHVSQQVSLALFTVSSLIAAALVLRTRQVSDEDGN